MAPLLDLVLGLSCAGDFVLSVSGQTGYNLLRCGKEEVVAFVIGNGSRKGPYLVCGMDPAWVCVGR